MTFKSDRRAFLKQTTIGMTGLAMSKRLYADIAVDPSWATLSGQIVYEGTPPDPKRVKVTKDQDVCGKYDLIDESLVVNRTSNGIKDVIISLRLERDQTITCHESYSDSEKSEVYLDNKCCRFDPHVTVMRTTQELVIRNLDPKGDTVMIDSRANTPINITLTYNQTYRKQYPNKERMPLRVSCAIHSWELGWLVVSEHPYVAVTDKDGKFEIRNIPIGKYTFMFWQEAAGYLSDVTMQGKTESWKRGLREFDLQPGNNDLGQIVVKPELFKH